MSEQYDEHEQGERVKQWLVKNGSNILTVFLLVIAGIAAWQWWQGKQHNNAQEAANQYQTFVTAIEKNDLGKASVLGTAFIKNYSKSDFAFLASLRMAKIYADTGKPELSLAALTDAKSVAHGAQQQELLDIRIAQLYLSQTKYEEASKQLNGMKPQYYAATYAELKGDLALAKSKNAEAATSYKEALAKLDANAGSRPFIEMKLSDAGGTAGKPSEIR